MAIHGIIRIFVKTIHYGCKVERHGRIYRYRHPRICQRHQLEEKQAYRYLNHYKAIDFLENQYDVAHTQSFDDIIEGLTALCQRHGGALV